jgi:hypothetical protein
MGLKPTTRKVIAMPARRSKAKSATRRKTTTRRKATARRKPAAKKTTTRKKATARRKPAAKKTTTRKKATARRKPAAKKTTTRKKATARRKPAAEKPEQLGAPLPAPGPVEPIMPVGEPSLIREEPTPQPASPLPETEEAEERGISSVFSEREEEPENHS